MLTLSTIVCVYFKQCNKNGCVAQTYDCSQAWEADMRGLMVLKAFTAQGH